MKKFAFSIALAILRWARPTPRHLPPTTACISSSAAKPDLRRRQAGQTRIHEWYRQQRHRWRPGAAARRRRIPHQQRFRRANLDRLPRQRRHCQRRQHPFHPHANRTDRLLQRGASVAYQQPRYVSNAKLKASGNAATAVTSISTTPSAPWSKPNT
ncbi:hypothetical protein LP420_32630 [Massilia sp. B-10]|nr:hypothetical protein LP420_32630 [Massilia sp. B-10]